MLLKPQCATVGSLFLLVMMWAAGARAESQPAAPGSSVGDLNQAVHALCGERVALLGEPPIHGFGNTLTFKVELVRRLVTDCHYNALFVESGVYDYLHIARQLRSGQQVPEAMISAAIGGLWANAEVQAMVPFLREKMKAGSLTLGGLDDAIGAGSYASRGMAADLVQGLATDRKARCLAILDRHLRWQYTEDAPYGPADKTKVVGCLGEIQAQLASASQTTSALEESSTMANNLQRNIARNFTDDDFSKKDQELAWINDRERSMDLNFKWLSARLPPHSKIILWAATVHTAKDLSGIPGFEGRIPLGAYIHRDYGRHAFSMGFSALSGEYAFTRRPVQRLSQAPATSLEARTFDRIDAPTAYLSRRQLRSFPAVPGRLLGTDFVPARWNEVVDGVELFRVEHAPAWSKRPAP